MYFYQCSHWWRHRHKSFFKFIYHSNATVSVCLYSFYVPPSFSRTTLWPHYEHSELSPARWTMGGGLGKEQQAEEIPHYKYRERELQVGLRGFWVSGSEHLSFKSAYRTRTVRVPLSFWFIRLRNVLSDCWNLCRVRVRFTRNLPQRRTTQVILKPQALPPVLFPSTGASFPFKHEPVYSLFSCEQFVSGMSAPRVNFYKYAFIFCIPACLYIRCVSGASIQAWGQNSQTSVRRDYLSQEFQLFFLFFPLKSCFIKLTSWTFLESQRSQVPTCWNKVTSSILFKNAHLQEM